MDSLTLALSISDPMYFGSEYFNRDINDYKVVKKFEEVKEQEELSEDNEVIEDKKFQTLIETAREQGRITDSIEEWHQYCIAVNEAKAFI